MGGRLFFRAVPALLLAAGTAVAGPAAPARADTAGPLPTTQAGAVLVDHARGRVFVTAETPGVASADSIRETVYANLAAGAPRVLPGLAGASAVATSEDGSLLYVALRDRKAVATLDAATLEEVAWRTTPHRPAALAVQDGRLWIAWDGSLVASSTGLSYVDDPAAETWQPVAVEGLDTRIQPVLTVSPERPGRVYLSGNGGLAVVDSAATPPAVLSAASVGTGAFARISRDGRRIAGVDGWGTDTRTLVVRDAGDGSVVAQWPLDADVEPVVSPDGEAVAVGLDRVLHDTPRPPVVRTYRVGHAAPVHVHTPVGDAPDALGWDGRTLYAAVTPYDRTKRVTLHRYDAATLPQTTIGLTAPATSPRGRPLTVQGALAFAGDGAPQVPRTVRLAKTDSTGTRALPAATTTASGTFSFGDVPQVGGTNTYTVTYDGDADTAPMRRSVSVDVLRAATSVTLTASATAVDQRALVTLVAHLGPTYDSRVVSIYAQVHNRARVLVRSAPVDGAGNLRVTVGPMTYTTTYTAVFAGDQRYAPAQAVRKVGVRLGFTSWLTRHYGTSGAYHLYRQQHDAPLLNTQLTPARSNLCLQLQGEYYSGGVWRTTNEPLRCHYTFGGRTYVNFRRDLPVGVPFRVRMYYTGDPANYGNYGPWKYFRFTR